MSEEIKRRYREAVYRNHYTDERGLWVEKPEAYGLRLVGYADEVCGHIKHQGWFVDDDCSRGVLRGQVYQLPTRKGKARFIAAYEESEGHGVSLDLSTVHSCRAISNSGAAAGYHEAAQDAALAADRLAETEAEEEREYQRAHDAGSSYSMHLEEQEMLVRQWRAVRRKLSRLCRKSDHSLSGGHFDETARLARLGDKDDELEDACRANLRVREELKRGARHPYEFSIYDDRLREAFNQGAEMVVLKKED